MTRPLRPAPLAALVAAVLLAAGCDAAEPEPARANASAVEVEYLGLSSDPFGSLALAFRYVGETPCPAYAYSGYGTSFDPQSDRISVEVHTRSTAEGCLGVVGTVVVDPLRIELPGAGTYTLAFERRGGEPPLEKTVTVDVEVTAQ